jgi:cell division protein ZapA (FtsZ GTPase activity inhibitor)
VQKQITILGRSYTLRADESDDIESAAAEVDRRVRELSVRAPAFDTTTLALITALNLASETRALRKRVRGQIEETDRLAGAVEAILEAALSESEEEGTA